MSRAPERGRAALALWGGHECTVSRVGDSYSDQTVRSGHQERLSDLALFAELGVAALRYPVLWERVSPHDPATQDWRWSDERLAELARLKVRPIVGLSHHGSGPIYTNLLDPGFAPGLAGHAAMTARRYPWVMDWSPVNEPLTTARFCALYGHWYPHLRDERACWVALLNQIDAIRLSMAAIRQVNSGARLIQTEDLGFTHGTPALGAQAGFENERRWMTWDLLCGAVGPGHSLFPRLAALGLAERLAIIAADPCPPDVVGVNHYITSERWLDEDLGAYPPHTHGGNGELAYADVEAVRAAPCSPLGVGVLLRSAWERYGLTVAVTECHIGSDVTDRQAWFTQTWSICQQLVAEGVSVEAVTAWSLLGAFDWNSLLTRRDDHYEPGVFQLEAGVPDWTAAGRLLQRISGGDEFAEASAGKTGWWCQAARLIYTGHPATEQILLSV